MSARSDWHQIASEALRRRIPLSEASRAYRTTNERMYRNPLPGKAEYEHFHGRVGHYLSKGHSIEEALRLAAGRRNPGKWERERRRTNRHIEREANRQFGVNDSVGKIRRREWPFNKTGPEADRHYMRLLAEDKKRNPGIPDWLKLVGGIAALALLGHALAPKPQPCCADCAGGSPCSGGGPITTPATGQPIWRA